MVLHAASIEWFWVGAGLFGVVINIVLLRTAMTVQMRINRDEHATLPERIIAAAATRQECLRLGKQSLIFVGGTASLFLAPPPPVIYDIPQTVVGVCTLVGVSLLMTTTSLFERKAQRDVAMATIHHRVPSAGGDTLGTRIGDAVQEDGAA